jgi:hypothetical protein
MRRYDVGSSLRDATLLGLGSFHRVAAKGGNPGALLRNGFAVRPGFD